MTPADAAPLPRPRHDLELRIPHRPGMLAAVGEALGKAGVSIEGGGGFAIDADRAILHFLVDDAVGARAALAGLAALGIELAAVRPVVVQRLAQDVPGQLGALARAMAEAGVNLECVYSDHDHQLVVCPDDVAAATRVAALWRAER